MIPLLDRARAEIKRRITEDPETTIGYHTRDIETEYVGRFRHYLREAIQDQVNAMWDDLPVAQRYAAIESEIALYRKIDVKTGMKRNIEMIYKNLTMFICAKAAAQWRREEAGKS